MISLSPSGTDCHWVRGKGGEALIIIRAGGCFMVLDCQGSTLVPATPHNPVLLTGFLMMLRLMASPRISVSSDLIISGVSRSGSSYLRYALLAC